MNLRKIFIEFVKAVWLLFRDIVEQKCKILFANRISSSETILSTNYY